MKIIRLVGFLMGLWASLLNLSCTGSQDNGLTISMVPTQPILIPFGTGTTIGGYFTLTAPYFAISSLNVNWIGQGNLNIIAVLMSLPTGAGTSTGNTPTYTVSCGFAGDDIKNMFPHNINGNGDVIIASGTPVASNPFGCGGVGIPSPAPTTFNIPIQVEVVGVTLDNNNNTTGRVESTTSITVQ